MTHQPVTSFPISFQDLFNRAGGRTLNVSQEKLIMKTRQMRIWTIELAALGLLLSAMVSNAAVMMVFTETGSGVTLTSTASFNTDHFILLGDGAYPPGVKPSIGFAKSGSPGSGEDGVWILDSGRVGAAMTTGSSPFGSSSNYSFATAGTGLGIGLRLDNGYFWLGSMSPSSGGPFTSTSTWAGETFLSLGLVVGTYTISWGSGADADSWTVAAIPEPSGAIMCSVAAGASLLRRRRQ